MPFGRAGAFLCLLLVSQTTLPAAATLPLAATPPASSVPAASDPDLPSAARLHLDLSGSAPATGDTLAAAPTELRLTFTEDVDPGLATLSLVGPDGAVTLSDPVRGSTGRELVARILDRPRAGTHTVRWRVVGADGHPVTGEIVWVVLPPAGEPTGPAGADAGSDDDTAAAPGVGPSAPGRVSPPASDRPPASLDGAEFDAESPGYAAIRWLTFLALLGALGAAAYGLLILPLARQRAGVGSPDAVDAARRSAATVGLIATGVLLAAAGLRLVAQAYAVNGPAGAFDAGRVGLLLTGTLWGRGWIVQVVASVVGVAAFAIARRGSAAGWAVAGVAVAALAFTPALSGHAAAVRTLAPLPVVVDGLHVLGAGGWLGTLLVLLLVSVRRAMGGAGGAREVPLATLVASFSAVALGCAALVVATGVFAAWLHLPSVPALWRSEYGRVLLLKVGLLLPLFALGAYNWRKVRPALDRGAGPAPLRRSGWIEVGVAVLVLLVTAVLVATPTPDPATHEGVAAPAAVNPAR